MKSQLLLSLAICLAVLVQVTVTQDCECEFPEQMAGKITVSLRSINNIVDLNYNFLVDYNRGRARIWHPRNTYFVIIDFDTGSVYNFTKVGGCRKIQENVGFNLPRCVPTGLRRMNHKCKILYTSEEGKKKDILSNIYALKYIVSKGDPCVPKVAADHVVVELKSGPLNRYYFLRPKRFQIENVWDFYPDMTTCT